MIKKNLGAYLLVAIMIFGAVKIVDACTNILVTKGASKDGSTMISYSADSHVLYGALYFRPAADYPEGAMVKVYDWDGGKFRGEIPQVRHTYQTVGNMNEHQLSIAETTYGGREELVDPNGIVDYGSLIYMTLQRAKTAREAIKVIDELVQTYGYGSSGESLSIADPNEVWIMEIIGKGEGNKGAVWVALKVPDGYICGHANQARITNFPLNDPENALYSKDVITFAREKGYFKGKDKDFSFCDAYAPLDFSAMRGCEARVWAAFNMFSDGMNKYLDYAMGHNPKNKMPLWVKPNRKLDISDVAKAMRDHYEGTPMDMTTDVGAGGEQCPYRWRPMNFEVDGEKYVNERAIATQQTGFWYISQSRSHLPDYIGGVNWFGVDDAGTSCLYPVYTCSNTISSYFTEESGTLLDYSTESAFWIFNRVAQFAYLRYNQVGKTAQEWANKFETKCFEAQPSVEATALELYKSSPEKARQYLTDYSVSRGNELFSLWNKLDKYLMVKFIDGNVKKEKDGKFLNNGQSETIPASPDQPGYSEVWKRAVVKSNGKTLLVPKTTKK